MESLLQECPVCTLYLRPGIALKTHLDTHPKEQVIEALIKVRDVSPPMIQTAIAQPSFMPAPQLTTAVTYQQILTTNPSGSLVPQFFQVPAVVNSPFTVSQNMGFAPTMFNPMYNPYVPQPYHPFNNNEDAKATSIEISPSQPENEEVSSEMEFSEVSSETQSPPRTPTPPPPPKPKRKPPIRLTPIVLRKNPPAPSSIKPEIVEVLSSARVKTDELKLEAEIVEHPIVKESEEQREAVANSAPFEVIADIQLDSASTSRGKDTHESHQNEASSDEGRKDKQPNGFDYVDEAANFSAPATSNPVYTDLLPATNPRRLQELLPGSRHGIMPTASSSKAYMGWDGLSMLLASGACVSSGSRTPTSPSVIQMADSTKKEMDPMQLNITADESMPARGELSEQESLGADSAWGIFQPEIKVDSVWPAPESKPLKCPLCPLRFSCPKERRAHKTECHGKPSKAFRCTSCEAVFSTLRERRAHMLLHTDSKVDVKLEDVPGPAKGPVDVSSPVRHCGPCCKTFLSHKDLRVHLREVHGEVRFRCEECQTGFDDETDYNAHLMMHPLKCNECGKCFYRRANLTLHMKRHLIVKPFACSICPKTFVTRQKLEEHMNGHVGVRPIKCLDCDKTFNRHSNLIQHKNLHHPQVKVKPPRDYVCHCGEVFPSQRKFEWHREIHENKPKSCPYCAQKFMHAVSVTRHVRRSHLPGYLPNNNARAPEENVCCPICDKIYLRGSLSVHMRVHNGIRPFQCTVCSKTFTTKWNMELHQWTHQSRSAMPYKCNLCKSAFFREADHIAHMNAHKNLKPFICNVCGQKFIRKYNCIRHQEEHQRAKRFICKVEGCKRAFHRSYYLKDHMKVHTGLRPHTCHICGKASSTKSNHNKHVRIHDNREMVNTEH